ncbi:hypothetical protein IHE45_14G052500 [Dioscorea alata]|uniref:Uncharacterized protein n=1 Tax=Dioscorea alata TaxID=55571 RepID=A0ACB7URW7_DIOAL|nr:hypothetical protein IHE45_14G052500 [Dioscorea alata]
MLKLSGWPRLTWGRGARAAGGGRSCPPTSRFGPCYPSVARRVPTPPRGGGATTSGTRRVAGPTLVARPPRSPRPTPVEDARPPRSPRPGCAPRFRVFSGLPRVCGGSRQ